MQVRYIGDPAENFDGPQVIEQYDISFVKNEFVEVPDDHPQAQKFKGNRTFEVKGSDRPKVDVDPEDDVQELRDELERRGVKFHHREKADSLRAKLSKSVEPGVQEDEAANPPVPK